MLVAAAMVMTMILMVLYGDGTDDEECLEKLRGK